MSELPDAPWQQVSVDFGNMPSGIYLLVVGDDYSRYPVVELVTSTSAHTTIRALDKIFATFRVPETVRSDNGPPFNSAEFRRFANYLGFKHRKVTPYWPRANGQVERVMRTLKKAIRTANAEGRSWKQELQKFLRNYRATPHSSTNVAPYTALFGRSMNTRLPDLPQKGGGSTPDADDSKSHIKECDKRNWL